MAKKKNQNTVTSLATKDVDTLNCFNQNIRQAEEDGSGAVLKPLLLATSRSSAPAASSRIGRRILLPSRQTPIVVVLPTISLFADTAKAPLSPAAPVQATNILIDERVPY
jgi:hypothetical protein